MKHSIHYLFFPFLLLFSSCDKEEGSPIEEPVDYVETAVRLEGELPESLVASPIEGEEKNNLYGIDIFRSDGTPYAYGLFDDISLAEVRLVKGKKYLFRAMAVPDGKEHCFDHEFGFYGDIFYRHVENKGIRGGGLCPLTNKFIYSDKRYFRAFNPEISYFYRIYNGQVPNYFAEGNDTLSINMKVMYGKVKLQVHNMPEGKLEFYLDETFPSEDSIVSCRREPYMLTIKQPEAEFVFSMRCWYPEYKEMPDDYSFNCAYELWWFRDNGDSEDLGIHFTPIQRKKENVVIIDMAELINKNNER